MPRKSPPTGPAKPPGEPRVVKSRRPGNVRAEGRRLPPLKPGDRTRKRQADTTRFVLRLIADQFPRPERLVKIMARYRCSDTVARGWDAEAMELLRQASPTTSEDLTTMKAEIRAGLEDTFRAARASGDNSPAVRALVEKARLYGLAAPVEVVHGGKVGIDVNGTLDRRSIDLRAEVAALTEKARGLAGLGSVRGAPAASSGPEPEPAPAAPEGETP